MPREYQIKIKGVTLPHNIYMQTKYVILDHCRICRERENILHSSPYNDGQPKSNGTGDPTSAKAIKLATIEERVTAVDDVAFVLNNQYSAKIKRTDEEFFDSLTAFEDRNYFNYVLYDPETQREPSRRSWNNFKCAFAHEVAKKMKIF